MERNELAVDRQQQAFLLEVHLQAVGGGVARILIFATVHREVFGFHLLALVVARAEPVAVLQAASVLNETLRHELGLAACAALRGQLVGDLLLLGAATAAGCSVFLYLLHLLILLLSADVVRHIAKLLGDLGHHLRHTLRLHRHNIRQQHRKHGQFLHGVRRAFLVFLRERDVVQAHGQVKHHAGSEFVHIRAVEQHRGVAELQSHGETQGLGEIVQQFRVALAQEGLGAVKHILQLVTGNHLLQAGIVQGQQRGIRLLDFLHRVHHKRTRHVGAVALVARTDAADDHIGRKALVITHG
mmetsp:Transcript_43731/g.76087  ORF Transcript_43731/g.76087 Transcript_43731/m.76087 type:complete len:299 (+) Transcript_43731:1575-2471(+)